MADEKRAFSMTIGNPEPVKEGGTKEFTTNFPPVKVLMALIKRNGVVEWHPIAVAVTKAQLDRAAGEWVGKFKDRWAGRMKTVEAPFVFEA